MIIPAHNEESVIARTLDALFHGIDADTLDVIVVCNGCRDATAEVARASGHPVRVVEIEQASKTAALRAGERVARSLPRLYLDADVRLSGPSALAVCARLQDGALAARPPIRYDTTQASLLVRRYHHAREQLPAVTRSLWGAGVCGVSAAGRDRFGEFPDLVADDVFLDLQFQPEEIEIVDCDPVIVNVPRRTADLARVLRRTYRGKRESRTSADADLRARRTTASAVADLRGLAATGPRGAFDAAIYAGFAIGVRLRLALGPAALGAAAVWERDDSSRVPA